MNLQVMQLYIAIQLLNTMPEDLLRTTPRRLVPELAIARPGSPKLLPALLEFQFECFPGLDYRVG
jgi:hypothetical protein